MAGPLDSIDAAIAAVQGLGDALTAFGRFVAGTVSDAMKAWTGRVGAAMEAVAELATAVAGLAAGPIRALADAVRPVVAPLAQLGSALGALAAGPLAGAAAQIESMMGGFATITAGLSGFRDAVSGAAQAMTPFIAALAPGLMEAFNYAMRTINATLATALMPAFQTLTELIQRVAGEISPVMHQLAPVLAQLAQTVAAVVVPIVQVMAASLGALTPLFKFLADALTALAPLFTSLSIVVQTVMQVIGQWLASLFGGDQAKGWMDGFRKAIETLAVQLVLLSGRIALLFGDAKGAGGFFDTLQKTVQDQLDAAKNPPKGEAPAPSGVGTSDLAGIGRQAAEASYLAGGGGDKAADPQIEIMGQILAGMKKMQQDDLGAILKRFWEQDMWPDILKVLGNAASGQVNQPDGSTNWSALLLPWAHWKRGTV